MLTTILALPLGITLTLHALAVAEQSAAEKEFTETRDAYVEHFRPLFIESSRAWWEANTTGNAEAFERRKNAETRLVELHSDRAVFARLKSLREGGQVKDPMLARELDVMYRSFLPGQADAELQKTIVALETEVEHLFNTHRSMVDGKPLSENDIREILSTTKDSAAAEAAWKGYMEVGAKIDPKLRQLVALRNELARKLGYRDYYAFKLALQEIDEQELVKLFDELDALTREPFAELKAQIDARMAERYGVPAEKLRPWNFNDLFFQEAPEIEEVNLDDLYRSVDLIRITKAYYGSMGIESEDILSRSDLYEKEGKSPHAFSISIDRRNDIRVLCNLKSNAYWADTLVHELGHAVYDKYIGPDVPFLLREPSHSITTEGFAMMMGAMTKNEDFLKRVVDRPTGEIKRIAEAARRSLRAEKLLFSRWTQVMMRFERGMYGSPDQNLGKLWWDLKKQYQLLNPPDDVSRPDYAAKIHVVTAPVYYHSYMMGDLFACQVHAYMARYVMEVDSPTKTSFWGSDKAGRYLRDKIFAPGNRYSWNELTKRATGEPLTARHFAESFLK
jgi:peptidyl-dipeptidase A